MDHFVTHLAWTWFQVSGDQTRERLEHLVLFYARQYHIEGRVLEQVLTEAQTKFVDRYGRKEE